MRFYCGLNPRWQMYKFLPDGLNIMYSAAGFWDGQRWLPGKFPKHSGYRWLDMGGFTVLNKYGDYPFTIGNALNLVARLCPDYYATLDYPCEPEISRRIGLKTNRERIGGTVKNAIAMSRDECLTGGQMVPVIQGYTLDEYKYCIDQYHDVGLIRDYMAVGSMCRRISKAQLDILIPGIYYHAVSAGAKRLHFFGLKLSKDLADLGEFIHSRDSAAILGAFSHIMKDKRDGRRFPRGQAEKKEQFDFFLEKVEEMGLQAISYLPKRLRDYDASMDWDCITDEGEIDRGTLLHILYNQTIGDDQ